MQKRANNRKNKEYEVFFAPIPAYKGNVMYYDKKTIMLPYAENFSRLHYHDKYEIGICEGGEGLFLSNGVYASVGAGDTIFVPPDCSHYSRSLSENNKCRCRFVYLDATTVSKYIDESALSNRLNIPCVIRVSDTPKAAELLTDIMDISNGNVQARDRLAILRLAVFLTEAERWFPSPQVSVKMDITHCKPTIGEADSAARFLSLHYNEHHSAKELAELFHLSESQLRRKFVSAYGMPPITYRNLLRCRIAAELLLRSELSIGAISDCIGYNSTSDFYRAFFKLYGVSPINYRKQENTKATVQF